MNNGRHPTWTVLLILLFPALLLAQEKTGRTDKTLTEPEELYEQLKQSKDRSQKLLAKRWRGLVQQRSWTDLSGKHKTFAKYLEHDPGLQWVKLLVHTGKGEEQTTKVVTVPLTKLDKNGQSVVKRIAIARRQIDELLSADSTEKNRNPGGYSEQAYAMEEGYSTRGEGSIGDEGDLTNPNSARGRDASRQQAERRQPAYPTEMEGLYTEEAFEREEDNGQIVAPLPDKTSEKKPSNRDAYPPVDPNQPNLPDQAPWRTSYKAFLNRLSATRDDRGEWSIDWGGLNELAARHEASQAISRFVQDELNREELQFILDSEDDAAHRLGEVVWEATLKSPILGPYQAIWFDFPPLPEPFGIVFLCEQENAGDFQRFTPGDRVQFIGRFDRFTDHHLLIMRIRFPKNLTAAPPATAAMQDDPYLEEDRGYQEEDRRYQEEDRGN